MTREEYRAWAEQQPQGRFKRINGVVVAMPPERSSGNQRKGIMFTLLHQAVRDAGLPCQALRTRSRWKSMTVIMSHTRCCAVVRRFPAIRSPFPDPLVIVEVLSPDTSAMDRCRKLREYFRIASLRHYLIVWPHATRRASPEAASWGHRHRDHHGG